MRLKQDLSIALVLAVIGCGMASPSVARECRDSLEPIEAAMDENEFTPEQAERVRGLIDTARRLQRDGDEDGAAQVMAEALELLRG